MIILLNSFIIFAIVFTYDCFKPKIRHCNDVKRTSKFENTADSDKYFVSYKDNLNQPRLIESKKQNFKKEKDKHSAKYKKVWAMNEVSYYIKRNVNEEINIFKYKYNLL